MENYVPVRIDIDEIWENDKEKQPRPSSQKDTTTTNESTVPCFGSTKAPVIPNISISSYPKALSTSQ